MKSAPLAFVALLLSITCAAACGEVDDTASPSTTDINRADEALSLEAMVLHDTCGETEPDKCESCLDRATQVQSRCRSACNTEASVTGNFAFNCADSCDSTPPRELCAYACDDRDAQPQCQQRLFEFELTTPSDPELYRACKAAAQRDLDCDGLSFGTNCDLYSRIESPEVMPTYECLAQRSCRAGPDDCYETLPPAELRQALEATCDSPIEATLSEVLQLQARWVLPELQQDLLICGERYCGTPDYERCLTAWFAATIAD